MLRMLAAWAEMTFFIQLGTLCVLAMSNRTEAIVDENVRVAALVVRAQNGEMAAFDELVLIFQSRMFNLAYRMVNNGEDAADLTQEIFVKMYRSINKFSGRSKFSTWLYALAANTCRSGLRRLRRVSDREVMRLDAEVQNESGSRKREMADPGETVPETIGRLEVKQGIEALIAELPEDARMVVVLRDLQGLTYEHIAETLQCSIGTVKSRLSRARLKLKERLTREGLTCAVKT
jgi:RNA polymerase sigma-70 factor, ECF subfamily